MGFIKKLVNYNSQNIPVIEKHIISDFDKKILRFWRLLYFGVWITCCLAMHIFTLYLEELLENEKFTDIVRGISLIFLTIFVYILYRLTPTVAFIKRKTYEQSTGSSIFYKME